VPRAENMQLFKKYQALADQMSNVHFLGRLGSYRYYNMDQVVGQALALYRRISRTAAQSPVLDPSTSRGSTGIAVAES
jgi:UDP-galactopyranose mutase